MVSLRERAENDALGSLSLLLWGGGPDDEVEETILKLFRRRGMVGETVVLIWGSPDIGMRLVAKAASSSEADSVAVVIAFVLERGGMVIAAVIGREEAGADKVDGKADNGMVIELLLLLLLLLLLIPEEKEE